MSCNVKSLSLDIPVASPKPVCFHVILLVIGDIASVYKGEHLCNDLFEYLSFSFIKFINVGVKRKSNYYFF